MMKAVRLATMAFCSLITLSCASNRQAVRVAAPVSRPSHSTAQPEHFFSRRDRQLHKQLVEITEVRISFNFPRRKSIQLRGQSATRFMNALHVSDAAANTGTGLGPFVDITFYHGVTRVASIGVCYAGIPSEWVLYNSPYSRLQRLPDCLALLPQSVAYLKRILRAKLTNDRADNRQVQHSHI